MKGINKKNSIVYLPLCCYSCLFLNLSCNNYQENNAEKSKTLLHAYKKPVSNYQDSLFINESVAIFYYPDSIQLLKIKNRMDSNVYDGTMHEFFYQMRNAKTVLQKSWPKIKIVHARDCRFLVFQKNNGRNEIIDIDNKNDAYGLFLFDQKKSPQLVDMTNIETALSTYFNQ